MRCAVTRGDAFGVVFVFGLRDGGGGDEGTKQFLNLEWASHFGLSIQDFIFPTRNFFGFGCVGGLAWGGGGGRPDHPPPPLLWISTSWTRCGSVPWGPAHARPLSLRAEQQHHALQQRHHQHVDALRQEFVGRTTLQNRVSELVTTPPSPSAVHFPVLLPLQPGERPVVVRAHREVPGVYPNRPRRGWGGGGHPDSGAAPCRVPRLGPVRQAHGSGCHGYEGRTAIPPHPCHPPPPHPCDDGIVLHAECSGPMHDPPPPCPQAGWCAGGGWGALVCEPPPPPPPPFGC